MAEDEVGSFFAGGPKVENGTETFARVSRPI